MKNANTQNKNCEQELQINIANLYESFSAYKLREKIDACPCGCISPEDLEILYSKSLRDLGSEELEKYSAKALTTWGDTYDFRHFLPRLFELAANDPYALTNMEIVFSKLNYGNWETWDQKERKIINEYFLALWKNFLTRNRPQEYSDSDSYLCAFSQAVEDPSPFLHIWQNLDDNLAYLHLKLFIQGNKDAMLRRALGNAFWEERQNQMKIIIDWFLSSKTREDLKKKISPSDNIKKELLESILKELETI